VPECESCRYYLEDELLDAQRCLHPVHYGSVTILPDCSTARDPTWWGKDACGPDGRFHEPCE
jgi:hypothetical protein